MFAVALGIAHRFLAQSVIFGVLSRDGPKLRPCKGKGAENPIHIDRTAG
jgi:hypothetical protein